jgi:hypothetical protein
VYDEAFCVDIEVVGVLEEHSEPARVSAVFLRGIAAAGSVGIELY